MYVRVHHTVCLGSKQNKYEALGGIAAILAVVGINGCVLSSGVNVAAFARSFRDSVLPPWGTDAEVAVAACKVCHCYFPAIELVM